MGPPAFCNAAAVLRCRHCRRFVDIGELKEAPLVPPACLQCYKRVAGGVCGAGNATAVSPLVGLRRCQRCPPAFCIRRFLARVCVSVA